LTAWLPLLGTGSGSTHTGSDHSTNLHTHRQQQRERLVALGRRRQGHAHAERGRHDAEEREPGSKLARLEGQRQHEPRKAGADGQDCQQAVCNAQPVLQQGPVVVCV
jgi:hypothetical protein